MVRISSRGRGVRKVGSSKRYSEESSIKKEIKNKRIHVTLYKEQLDEIGKYKGLLGESDSEIIRMIIVDWLLDHKFKEEGK